MKSRVGNFETDYVAATEGRIVGLTQKVKKATGSGRVDRAGLGCGWSKRLIDVFRIGVSG